MKKFKLSFVACSVLAATNSFAATDIFFNPLTQSAAVASPNHVNELNSPWLAPAGVKQKNLTSMSEIEASIDGQSVVRVSEDGVGGPSRLTNASMWDMVSYDETGRYIFIPHETFTGAGVTRYDIKNDFSEILFRGDNGGLQGDWSNDWGAFDPSTYTPNNTVWLGEEWSGEGRIIEVVNPKAPAHEIEIREVENIANVSHEGLRFSDDGKTIYYVDEWRSGSFYKFVAKKKYDYTVGQTFVLRVDAYDGNAADMWNDPSNEGTVRTGLATWVPLTNKNGSVNKTNADPFSNGPTNDPRENDDTRGGRVAADEVGATPYARPEDLEIGFLNNGNEVVYVAVTEETAVYAIEMLSKRKAIVKIAVQGGVTPKNLGHAPTTGVLNSPDNLAQDALGNIYVIEDAPNGSDVGGDIWFVRDVNNDGVAESLDHFLSIQADGSEATGMIFNPVKPTEFVVAVQHPDSTNLAEVEDGFGDALWKFNLKKVVPPKCKRGNKVKTVHGPKARRVVTCSKSPRTNFVKALKKAGKYYN